MATLALGLAGAAVGGFIGGPLGAQVGWMLGAAAGSALFPDKVQGPRLDDLKLHNSSYGNMTPFLYGTMRVAGNIIDEQPELTEHSDTSGSKGGPEVTSYTYSCSFAVRLCEGPILGIIRIWANGRLIYDHTGADVVDNNLPMTIYLGDEEQLPDPTLETIHGVGNVPGYRGIAYVVFTDLLLTEFGNTLPVLNFEVYTHGTAGEIPQRISSWNTTTLNGDGGVENAEWDDAAQVIHMGAYQTSGGHGGTYYEQDYDIMGVPVGSLTTLSTPDSYGPRLCYVTNKRWVAYATNSGSDAHWFVNGLQGAFISGISSVTPGPATSVAVFQEFASLSSAFVFTPSSTRAILAFACDDSGPGLLYASCDISAYCSNAGDINLATGDNDCIYCFIAEGTGTLLELTFDDDNPTFLIVSHVWDIATDFPSCGGGETYRGGGFLRYHDLWATNFQSFSTFKMNLLDVSDPAAIALYPQARSDPNDTPDFVWAGGNITPLFDGYVIGKDGVVLLDASPQPDAVPLSEIVANLSERSGLDATHYDVDELTDLVDGYLVNQQATGRDMIQPLRDGYFFDAVERDNQVVFVKRGHDAVVAIPDDELAGHGDGEQVPPIVGTVRAQEVDLPCVVNVDYINLAADYQTGTQQARRQVTQSQSEVSLTIPVSMTDAKAKSVADTQLYIAWMERNRFSFFTSRKYAHYEPTDVVTVGTRDMRLVEKTETRPGVVKWDAVEAIAEVLLQGGGGAVSVDFVPSPPGGVVVIGDTVLYLFDLPLVSEADDEDGFYAGMAWDHGAGAGLYKSADGVTYASVASTTVPATMGTATNTLGDFSGGNWPDEANWVDVVMLEGELASTTDDGLLNGANLAVVGDEVLQFKRAELTDVLTYRLTGLLRGRLGTEFAMGSHTSDEEFALLPTTIRVHQDYAELYASRSFKAVTFTKPLADADAQSFTNTGAARRPWSPQLLGGGTDGAGDVELHWTRRTRLGGGAWTSMDVPLSEPEEAYSVLIWNSTYTLCAREIVVVAATSTTYSAADQVTDFGATQQTIFFSVRQVGTAALGTEARGSAPGAGASNVDPLAPITPP